jgi:hypothetical protein
MSNRKTKRPMSEPEQEFLRDILKNAKTSARRWKIATVNAVLYYSLSVLAFVVVWKVIAWMARSTLSVEIGWHSPAAVWIVALGAVACVPPAIISSARWLKSQSDIRPSLRAALEKGLVTEEAYQAGIVISRHFSGSALDPGKPLEISVDPQVWPEPETY